MVDFGKYLTSLLRRRKMKTVCFVLLFVSVVFADTDELKSVKEGDSVTLHIDVNKQLNDLILWFFNNTRIALNNGERDKSCVYDGADGMFRGRLELDYETGSLTITNITTEHTGRYEANIIRGNSTGTSKPLNRTRKCDSTKINSKSSNSGDTIKTFNVNVNAVPGSGLSSAAVAGIVVGVLLVAAAAVGVIYYRDRKSRNGGRRNNEEVLQEVEERYAEDPKCSYNQQRSNNSSRNQHYQRDWRMRRRLCCNV
ncbi:uncharacterized protein LOC107710491 [Sinocyclocheilus rhinocerous]|uniref:uncharacterized protein LOC107710491 n=1 Tax=Sinocyclocheilus rhinocerous TaxID=307959 RepID=UPI0007B8E678|nr:PREDICTED: uncharacterized protein LOC107710491 [Sinocyclocheilus rhinocerous]